MRTEPILRYFKYLHLPPHLQEISRPFAELAERLGAGGEIPPWQELQPLFQKLRAFVRALPAVDSAEKDYADAKLSETWVHLFEGSPPSVPLRFLLEAKDCAVRAMLPLETAEASSEKPTTALHPPTIDACIDACEDHKDSSIRRWVRLRLEKLKERK